MYISLTLSNNYNLILFKTGPLIIRNGNTTMRLGPKRYRVNWIQSIISFLPPPPTITQIKGDKRWNKLKKRQTDLTLVTSEVKVTSGRWIVLLAVTGSERDPHHPFGVSTGQPPFHVVLVSVKFPSPIVVRNIRDFPHPWQGVDGTFRSGGVVLLKMHMHFAIGSDGILVHCENHGWCVTFLILGTWKFKYKQDF